jgi:hypothetical protein
MKVIAFSAAWGTVQYCTTFVWPTGQCSPIRRDRAGHKATQVLILPGFGRAFDAVRGTYAFYRRIIVSVNFTMCMTNTTVCSTLTRVLATEPIFAMYVNIITTPFIFLRQLILLPAWRHDAPVYELSSIRHVSFLIQVYWLVLLSICD